MVQRTATKMMVDFRNKKYPERLLELHLMPTEYRRNSGDMIATYKIMNGQLRVTSSLLEINKDSRTRGHSKKLKIKRTRTESRRNFFTRRVCSKWNDLGQQVIDSPSVVSFKKAYDQQNWNTSTTRGSTTS